MSRKITEERGIKFISLEVAQRTPDVGATVNRFLDDHLCTIFHEPAFNGIVRRNFNTEFYYRAVIESSGRLLAVCPLHVIKNGWMSVLCSSPAMYEVPYGGWIYKKERLHIDDLMRSMGISFSQGLTYWSIPQLEGDDYAGYEPKTGYQTSVIDLRMEKERIWDSVIDSKRRNMIRKAEKNHVAVRILQDPEFDVFHSMLQELYRDAKLETKPKDYYLQLLQEYGKEKKMIIMTAERNGEPLAGVVLLRNKYLCHYWLGAGRKDVENLGQGEILQWEAIKWAKEMGCQYYDMCVVETERLPNIARFKLGFSRTTVPFYCITKKKLGYKVGLRVKNVLG